MFYMQPRAHTHARAHTHTHIHTYIHTYTHAYIHTYTHARTYEHTHEYIEHIMTNLFGLNKHVRIIPHHYLINKPLINERFVSRYLYFDICDII